MAKAMPRRGSSESEPKRASQTASMKTARCKAAHQRANPLTCKAIGRKAAITPRVVLAALLVGTLLAPVNLLSAVTQETTS
jgi:hypothetical protein